MSELEDELARLNYDFEDELIEVEPLMDYPDLRFDGVHYNLLKGRVSELPLWIAEILEERGIVQISIDRSKSFANLKSIVQKEKKYAGLSELDRLLYRRIRKEIEKLRSQNNQISLSRLSSIEGSLNQILRTRTRKIMQLVRDDEGSNNPNMTAEEEWLFETINSIYKNWKDKVGKGAFEEYEY